MKKIIITAMSALLTIVLLCLSVINAFAAVYIQDNNFRYQLLNNDTLAWAGYTSETVDDVTLPRSYGDSNIVSIANFGLENNKSIRSVDFMEAPDLSRIGMYAFYRCTSLEKIVIPASISNVGVSAFRECTALNSVEFYGNENVVPTEAFYDCSSLQNVRLSAYLKSIQSRAFANCTAMKYLELIDTITYIAPNAFEGDTELILGVWYGSYAHQYAIDNNINYTLLDGVKLGDVDGDGDITITDATAIQRYLAELETLDAIHLYAADANEDKEVDIADATAIQMSVAKIPTGHPIGEVITK